MKEYNVIPFTAAISSKDSTHLVAQQLSDIINTQVGQGWDFESVQSIQTAVTPVGCFGAQEKSKTNIANLQMVIFSRPK